MRIRPLNSKEIKAGAKSIVHPVDDKVGHTVRIETGIEMIGIEHGKCLSGQDMLSSYSEASG